MGHTSRELPEVRGSRQVQETRERSAGSCFCFKLNAALRNSERVQREPPSHPQADAGVKQRSVLVVGGCVRASEKVRSSQRVPPTSVSERRMQSAGEAAIVKDGVTVEGRGQGCELHTPNRRRLLLIVYY